MFSRYIEWDAAAVQEAYDGTYGTLSHPSTP